MKNNRIIIIGDKGMAGMPEDLNDAFENLGYKTSVYYFYYNKFIHKIAWGFINTPFKLSKKIGNLIMNHIITDINHKFVNEILVQKPDFIVVINGFNLSKDSLSKLKMSGIKIIDWVVDDPSRARFSNFIEASNVYDIIFCCSKNWLDYVKIWNKNIIYLPLAVNPQKYKDNHTNNYKYDICFVGTFTENDPSTYFRFYLLDFLSNFNYKIRIAGNNALNYLRNKNDKFIVSDRQPLSKVMDIYQNSKIVFNPYNTYNQDVVSLRIFEVGNMNIFQIVPFQEELHELFDDKIVSFKDTNELSEKVSYYLTNDSERFNKAKELGAVILEKHTYVNRAKTIIQVLES